MKRANCPDCKVPFPWLIFKADRRRARGGDGLLFQCHSCRKEIHAARNDVYRKNRLIMFFSLFLGTPLFLFLSSYMPELLRLPTFMLMFSGLGVYLLVRGHHLMDFSLYDPPPESSEENHGSEPVSDGAGA